MSFWVLVSFLAALVGVASGGCSHDNCGNSNLFYSGNGGCVVGDFCSPLGVNPNAITAASLYETQREYAAFDMASPTADSQAYHDVCAGLSAQLAQWSQVTGSEFATVLSGSGSFIREKFSDLRGSVSSCRDRCRNGHRRALHWKQGNAAAKAGYRHGGQPGQVLCVRTRTHTAASPLFTWTVRGTDEDTYVPIAVSLAAAQKSCAALKAYMGYKFAPHNAEGYLYSQYVKQRLWSGINFVQWSGGVHVKWLNNGGIYDPDRYTLSFSYYPGLSDFNYMQFDNKYNRFTFHHNMPWAPFICTRALKTFVIRYRDSADSSKPCYHGRECRFTLSLAEGDTVTVANTNGITDPMKVSVSVAGLMTFSQTEVQFLQGGSESNNLDLTRVFTAADTTAMTITVTPTAGSGYKTLSQALSPSTIATPKPTFAIDTTGLPVPSLWYIGATWNGRLAASTTTVNPGDVSVSNPDQFPTTYGEGWVGQHRTFAMTAAAAGTHAVHFTTASGYYVSPSASATVTVLEKIALTLTLAQSFAVVGEAITFTAAGPSGMRVVDAATFHPSFSCEGATISPTSETFAQNAVNPSKTFTLTPGSVETAQDCTLTIAASPAVPQFKTGQLTVRVKPKLRLSVSGLPDKVTKGVPYTFTIASNGFHSGSVSIASQCGGATMGSAVALALGTHSGTTTITAPAVTTETSCALALTVTGTTATHFLPFAGKTVEYSDKTELAVEVNTTAPYVGEGVLLKLSEPSQLTPGATVNVTWTVTGAATVEVATGTLSLANGQPTATVALRTTSVGALTISFVATVPLTFQSTLASLSLTVKPLLLPIVAAPLTGRISLGPGYSRTVAVTLSPPPWQGSVTVTPIYDATVLAVTTASATWNYDDAVFNPAEFTITAHSLASGVSVAFRVTGTASSYNTTGVATVDAGALDVYRRATLGVEMVGPNTTYAVQGNTLSFRVTATRPLPHALALTLDVSPARLVVSPPTAVTIAAGTNATEVVIAPVPGVGSEDLSIAMDISDAATAASKAEVHVPSRPPKTTARFLFWRTVTVECDKVTLFFGPGNQLNCTLTATGVPKLSEGTVTLSGSDTTEAGVTITPQAAVLGASGTLQFLIAPDPAVDEISVTGGTTQTVSISLADTSLQFSPAPVVVTYTASLLRRTTVTMGDTSAFVGAAVTVTVTLPGQRANAVVVSFVDTPLLTASAAVTVPANETSTSVTFSVTASGAGDQTSRFKITGEPTAAPYSDDFTLSAASRLVLEFAPSHPPVTGAGPYFVGQNITVTATLSGPVPEGRTLDASLSLACVDARGGTNRPGTGAVLSTTFLSFNGTVEAVLSVSFAALPCRAVGASSSQVRVSAVMSGTAKPFSDDAVSTAFDVHPLVSAAVATPDVTLYGGSDRSSSFLRLTVASPPIGTSVLQATFTSDPPGVLQIANRGVVSAFTGPLVTSFASNILPEEHTEEWRITASAVAVTTSVTVTCTLGGTAALQYGLTPPEVTFTVHPRLMISVAGLGAPPAVAAVTALIGHRGPENFVGNLTVSLPQSPRSTGDAAADSVIVEPVLGYAPPDAAMFVPSSVEFVPGGLTVQTISVFAVASTEANADSRGADEVPRIRFKARGGATQFIPVPAALPEYHIKFSPRARVLVPQIARVMTVNATETFQLTLDAAPTATVTASIAIVFAESGAPAPASALDVLPSIVRWLAGESGGRSVTLKAGAAAGTVALELRFSVAGPLDVDTVPSAPTAPVTVITAATVALSLPPFVYANGDDTFGSVRISAVPAYGVQLEATPAVIGPVVPVVPSVVTFDPTSPVQRQIAVTAARSIIPAGSHDSVAASVILNIYGTASRNYVAPPPLPLTVRPLERIIVRGLPRFMFVGQSAAVTVRLSRPPECGISSTITVTPRFPTPDAVFSPASASWKLGANKTDSVVFSLTAASASASVVPVFFDLSGDCLQHYTAVTDVDNTDGTSVLPPVPIAMSFDDADVQLIDGASVASAYPNTTLTATITIPSSSSSDDPDAATPAVHEGVVVLVEYLGRNDSIGIEDSGRIVFAAGATSKSISLSAALVSDTAALRLTIVGGASADRFAAPAAASWPLLRVVRRIAATLVFDPATRLLVAGRTSTIDVTLAQAPPVGMALTVSLHYGGLTAPPEPLVFPAASPKTTLSFTVTPPVPVATQALRIVLSGPGIQAFEAVPAAGVLVPVLQVQTARLTLKRSFLFVGDANAMVIEASLSQAPALSGSEVSLSFSDRSPLVTFSKSLLKLSAATPKATITVTGVAPGTVDLPQFVTVSDSQSEYDSRPRVLGGSDGDRVTIKALHTATPVGYGGLMYTNGTAALTLRIPAAPSSGTVSLRPVLGNPAYPLTLTPPTVEFPAGTSVLEKTITLTAPATKTLPTTELRIQATGTAEFAKIAATTTLAVLETGTIGLFDFPSTIFSGAANKKEFAVSFPALPSGADTVEFRPTSLTSAVVFSPTAVTLRSNSTAYVVNGVPTVRFSLQSAEAVLPAAVTETVGFTVTASNPSAAFNTLATASLRIDPPRSVTAELTGVASQAGGTTTVGGPSVLYVGSTATAALTFADAGSLKDLTATLRVVKRAAGASQQLQDVPSSEVFVAAYTAIPKAGRVAFAVTALKAGLTVTLLYTLSGADASTVNTSQIPQPEIFFAQRDTITYAVPEAMYVGLEAMITITLGSAPKEGSLAISPSIPNALLGSNAAPSQLWSATMSTDDLPPLAWSVPVTPVAAGVWSVSIYPAATGTAAYDTTGGTFTVVVRPPTVIEIRGVQGTSFVAPNRQLLEVVLSTPLDSGETVQIQLHKSSNTVTVNPSGKVELTATGNGRQRFMVQATTATVSRFYASFTSTTNRFILGRSANRSTGPVSRFLPLKLPTVTPPPTLDFVVGQRAAIQVSVAQLPSPGHVLVASLKYFGSPANVQLPPAVQWTSSDTVKTRTLEVLGISATERETLRVVFSKDTEYKLNYADDLSVVQMNLIFTPKFNVDVGLPSSLFMGRDVSFNVKISSPAALTLRITTDPAGIFVLTPSEITFMNNVQPISVTARASSTHDDGPVSMMFEMVGGETIKFNPVPVATTTVIDSTTLLVKVPVPQMTLYIVPGYSVGVHLELGLDPTGPLTVQPRFVCPGSAVPFRMDPVSTVITAGDLVKQVVLHHENIVQLDPCTVHFDLSGSVGEFKPPSQLFTVIARRPHNISLVDVPTRIFIGEDNAAPLKVALDADSPLPLSEPITVTFSTTDSCLKLSPASVSWADGNPAEPFVKSISVTGSCIGNGFSVTVEVTTTSRKFYDNTPSRVVFDVRSPMKVAITSDAFSGISGVYYYMFLGSVPLTLTATLPEPLEAGETLTVRMQYDGFEGSTSLPEGTFVGGGAGGQSRSLVIEAFSVAPIDELRFAVTGPPRFAPFAAGGGQLEVFGPLYVTAEFPTTLYEGQSETAFILAQELPFGAETLVATPKWHGAPESLQFAPPNATWLPRSLDLKQPITLKALEPSEGYTLDVPVSGSTRYTPSAFNSIVQILPQYVVTMKDLPRQLTVGRSYRLVVNIERQPVQAGGYLQVRLIPRAYSSRRCIEIVPDRLTFRTDATAGDGVEQRVTVTARTACPPRSIRAAITGRSATVRRYNLQVVPYMFETLDPQPVALSWPVQIYAGVANAPQVLAQLLWNDGSLPTGAWLTLSIEATPAGIINPNSTSTVTWREGSSAEAALNIYALENAGGDVNFAFAVSSSDVGVHGTVIPNVTMQVLPKRNLTRGVLPTEMYSGAGNRLRVAMTLDPAFVRPENTGPAEITVTPKASSSLVSFVPSLLRWTTAGRAQRPLFIEGASEAANVSVSFEVSGTGAAVLAATPAPAIISILARLNVTFTSPPSELYVGADNSATVWLTAPDGVALTVRALVDGEPTAIVTTPATLRWETWSPRRQPLRIQGVYATPLQCRIRYDITEGPPFVGMAVLADVSKSLIKLLALRKVQRTPADYHIKAAELSKERLVFTPAVHVLCSASDPTIVSVRNAPNASTDAGGSSSSSSGSSSSGNETDTAGSLPVGTVYLDLIAPGTVEISCAAVDPTVADPPSFLVTSTAKKRITVTPAFTTFVNTSRTAHVTISERPGPSPLTVRLNLLGDAGEYVTLQNFNLQFTSKNDMQQPISFIGLRETPAPVRIQLEFNNIIRDYRPPDPDYILVTVRPLVSASAAPAPRTVFKHATLVEQQASGVHDVYVGAGNGFTADVTISGPSLTGPLYLTPVLLTGSGGVNMDPVRGSHVQFPIATTQLTAQVSLSRDAPTPEGDDVTTLVLRPFNPPQEYGGASADIFVAKIRFVPLERLTLVGAASFPETLFTGFANRKPLSIEITDFPGTEDVVSVALGTPSFVRAIPAVLDFNRPTAARSEPLRKTVFIQGLYPNSDLATVTLTWRALPSSSAAFVTTPVVSTVTTRVSTLFKFRVTHDAKPATTVRFYTGKSNTVYLVVSVTGLPLDPFGFYKVNLAAENSTTMIVSPSVVTFSKSQNNQAVEATVAIHGVAPHYGQQYLRFTAAGPAEFVQGQTMLVQLDALKLRQFEVEGMPDSIPIGIDNRRQVRIRPVVPSSVTLSVYTDCSQMAFSAAGSSTWGGTMEWQTYEVAATSTTAPTSPCTLYADIVGGADGPTYVPKQVSHKMRSVARPRFTIAGAQGVPLIDPSEIAAGSRFLTLQLSGEFAYAAHQLFDGTTQENATIAAWSSYSSAQQPNSVQAALESAPSSLLQRWTFDKKRSALTVRIGPIGGFTSTSKETVTIQLRRHAIDGSVALDKTAAAVHFQVNGKPAQTVNSGAKSVISNGASAAVVAGGILSLGAATQAGKLQTIMDAFYCPNPDWKLDQESMDWTEAPIPISFGATDDLGVYAAVGFSNSLIIFGFLLIHLTIVSIIYRVRLSGPYTDKSFAVAMALGRFPSISLFPVLFFIQAIVASGVRTVLHSPVSIFRIVASVSLLLFGLGLPVAMYLRTGPGFSAVWVARVEEDNDNSEDDTPSTETRNPTMSSSDEEGVSRPAAGGAEGTSGRREPKQREEVKIDGSGVKKVFNIIFGEVGHWEHPSDYYWTMRNGAFFDEFREGFQWWQVLDVLIVVVIGVVEGIVPKTHSTCVVRNIINIFLFFLQFAITVLFRPYRSLFGNLFFGAANFLQFLSMLLVGIAFFLQDPDSTAFTFSTQVLLLFSFLLLAKAAIDAVFAFRDVSGIYKMLEKNRAAKFGTVTAEEEEEQVREVSAQLKARLREDTDRAALRFDTAVPLHEGERSHLDGLGRHPPPQLDARGRAPPPPHRERGFLRPEDFLDTDDEDFLNPTGFRRKSKRGASSPVSPYAGSRITRQQMRNRSILGPQRFVRVVARPDGPQLPRQLPPGDVDLL